MSQEQMQSYKEKILQTTEELFGRNIRDHILHEELFGPNDFRGRYHAFGGNALSGGAHLFRQTAIFRPNNVSKKVSGLYYAGGYTNPGLESPRVGLVVN